MDTPAAPFTGRSRLLLVENDETTSVALTKVLAACYDVEAVPDPFAAAASVRRHPVDLAIIDLYLPGTDNLTLIRSVRADPRTVGIPIIILAAPAHRELLLRCLNTGASNFLLKPFGIAELLMCVRTELLLRPPPGAPTALSHRAPSSMSETSRDQPENVLTKVPPAPAP